MDSQNDAPAISGIFAIIGPVGEPIAWRYFDIGYIEQLAHDWQVEHSTRGVGSILWGEDAWNVLDADGRRVYFASGDHRSRVDGDSWDSEDA